MQLSRQHLVPHKHGEEEEEAMLFVNHRASVETRRITISQILQRLPDKEGPTTRYALLHPQKYFDGFEGTKEIVFGQAALPKKASTRKISKFHSCPKNMET